MRRTDFHYDLPASLIAQHPPTDRLDSRMLYLNGDTGALQDLNFIDLKNILRPGDVLVFNNTKVMPARLMGRKKTGGKIEILVERILVDTPADKRILAHVRSNKSLKITTQLIVNDILNVEVIDRHESLFELRLNSKTPIVELLERHGQIPLPPYIARSPDQLDQSRYQTVYASERGAVAAPTAGLHFMHGFIQELENIGVKTCFVTLHVGSGTFQPVRVDNITEHKMHSEYAEVPQSVCKLVNAAKTAGHRVIAVGTTALRSLETAWQKEGLKPFNGDTDIFIYPGVAINCVDALITNFHLPESTLLMLVSAFGGYENIMSAYQHAIDQKYRFFSYGDAMFIIKQRA